MPDDVVTASVQLAAPDGAFYSPDAQWRTFADQHAAILDQIRRESGIEAAGATSILPLEIASRFPYEIDGDAPRRTDDRLLAQFDTVSDGYFESMKAPLVMGRAFAAFDTYTSVPVVIVNETFVNRHRDSGRPVIGRRVTLNCRDRRSACEEPDGAVSAKGEPESVTGCLRNRRRRQRRPKRAARSSGGADDLFQRQPVSVSRDVFDGACDGHRHRSTGDPTCIECRFA
jgi:hypothetical protein